MVQGKAAPGVTVKETVLLKPGGAAPKPGAPGVTVKEIVGGKPPIRRSPPETINRTQNFIRRGCTGAFVAPVFPVAGNGLPARRSSRHIRAFA